MINGFWPTILPFDFFIIKRKIIEYYGNDA